MILGGLLCEKKSLERDVVRISFQRGSLQVHSSEREISIRKLAVQPVEAKTEDADFA